MNRPHRMAKAFIHPKALVESRTVGTGTRVWAFTHIMEGAVVGRDCNIGEHCYIERGAVIGDRVTIKNHVAVWDGVQIEDDAFIGPQACLTNDLRPRSRAPGWIRSTTRICRGATIGANATILPGLTIGRYALIGAGAVVTQPVAGYALVVGNPARRRGWVCRCAQPLRLQRGRARCRSCGGRYALHQGRLEPLGQR